jgi:hypothetical protein
MKFIYNLRAKIFNMGVTVSTEDVSTEQIKILEQVGFTTANNG